MKITRRKSQLSIIAVEWPLEYYLVASTILLLLGILYQLLK